MTYLSSVPAPPELAKVNKWLKGSAGYKTLSAKYKRTADGHFFPYKFFLLWFYGSFSTSLSLVFCQFIEATCKPADKHLHFDPFLFFIYLFFFNNNKVKHPVTWLWYMSMFMDIIKLYDRGLLNDSSIFIF